MTSRGERAWLWTIAPYALILAVGIVVLLPKLGQYGFWDPWEPKYAQSVREMSERGSFAVPYYRDEVRLTKPILVYWGVMAGSKLFGLNELGARIGGVAMAIGSMLGVFYAVSLLRGRQAGIISAVVLGTFSQFVFLARQSTTDVYLFTSLGISLLFLCLGIFGPELRRNLHFIVSYACFALAVLAKGPVVTAAIMFTTLAIYAVARIDLQRLVGPELRRESFRFAAAVLPAVPALVAAAGGAFLFGTSSKWWSYTDHRREAVEEFRDRLLTAVESAHLATILLVLLLLGALVLLWTGLRGKKRSGPRGAIVPGLFALVALVTLISGGIERRIFVGSMLLGIGAAGMLFLAARRLLDQPGLREEVGPVLKPIGRQALLFLGVFAMVAGPWHLAIWIHQDSGYFTDFIIKHNVQRARVEINNAGDASFYLKVLVFGLFPWSCFIPAKLISITRRREGDLLRRYGLEVFLLIASLVTYVLFSSATTKFSHYLAPILIPMAVLIGIAISRMMEDRDGLSRVAWIGAAALFLVPALDILNGEGAKHLLASFTQKRWVPAELEPAHSAYYWGILLAFAACTLLLALFRSRILLAALLASGVLLANYHSATLIPRVSLQKTMKNLCESWQRYGPDEPIGFYGDTKHGVYFYTERKIQRVRSRTRDFVEFMNPAKPAYCLMQREKAEAAQRIYDRMYPEHPLYVVNDSHRRYVLVANHVVPGAGEFVLRIEKKQEEDD